MSLMNVFLHQPNRYPIVTVIARALWKVSAWIGVGKSQGLNPLVLSCIENGPKGWSQNVSVSCTCQDCQLLQTFLTSSTQSQIRFQMPINRRLHIEKQLMSLSFYATHHTIRSGSPHTLVVEKTKQSFEKIQSEPRFWVVIYAWADSVIAYLLPKDILKAWQ